jgi:hypothetical protein
VRPQRDAISHVANGIAEIEVDCIEVEFARLHSGHVENVVDHG